MAPAQGQTPTPGHTPSNSTSNATTAGATAVDSSPVATVVSRPTAGLQPATTSAPTGIVRIPCAAAGAIIQANHTGKTYSFLEHKMVKASRALFSLVQLVEVRIFVYQRSVWSAPPAAVDFAATTLVKPTGASPFHLRIGLAPRGVVTHRANSSTGVLTPIADSIPNLRNFVTSPTMGTSATYEYALRPTSGAMPFPGGLQTDLRAAEIRHNYAEVVVANASYVNGASYEIAFVQVDFVIECSGSNFGEVPE